MCRLRPHSSRMISSGSTANALPSGDDQRAGHAGERSCDSQPHAFSNHLADHVTTLRAKRDRERARCGSSGVERRNNDALGSPAADQLELAVAGRDDSERLTEQYANPQVIDLIEDYVGGEGGIRTHVPLRTTRFRGAPVTTTSVPLRSEWTVPDRRNS
jgi:hypothetical protein